MTSPLLTYLKSIESELIRGDATEHTHRPALKTFIETLSPDIIATNEPTHVECGAPDFLISSKVGVIGYIETKEVGVNLNQTERSDQIKRYLPAFRNFILTDYLEFRWYVDGALRRTITIASTIPQGSGLTLKIDKSSLANLEALLTDFLTHKPEPITSPNVLAQRLARLAHLIRDGIIAAFNQNKASETLMTWRATFAKILIAGLDKPEKLSEFADMFAQTLAYGLFSARIMDETSETFTLDEAKGLIPETNPFLRDFFYEITGPKSKKEPFSTYVDDLVDLLAHSDMNSILANFGKRTKTEDPVVHFYETFLAAYDPKLREMRGVYYTPQPVVDFIVRAVDEILKTKFNLKDGIADSSLITNKISGGIQDKNQHKVLILDPACGTGTFLYNVIDLIRNEFISEGNAGMWSGYVRNHLLPRLYGFEILMAPYAVAHFKLALQLKGLDLPEKERNTWAYDFAGNERLNIFLTNTLEEVHEYSDLPIFMSSITKETFQANKVKQDLPIMAIIGNPPYSNFGKMNRGDWIIKLLDTYKFGLNERKHNIDDDFIKFIRWAQWKINRNGYGILAYISNNTFIDGITHRIMRKSLLNTFPEIYILNLHGSIKKHEKSRTGLKDENVFDIQQGVSINIFIRNDLSVKKPIVHYSDLYGLRSYKYDFLLSNSLFTIKWEEFHPSENNFFFFPTLKTKAKQDYSSFVSLNEIFISGISGIQTGRDEFVSKVNLDEFNKHFNILSDQTIKNEDIALKEKMPIWKGFDLNELRSILKNEKIKESVVKQWLYRPFDVRPLIFHSSCIKRQRGSLMEGMLKNNLSFICVRQVISDRFDHFFVTKYLGSDTAISLNTREYSYYLPLFIYPKNNIGGNSINFKQNGLEYASPNLNANFISRFSLNLGLKFIPEGNGDLKENFGPEDIFNYIYAVTYSPTYRILYLELLKIDFPRIPITGNLKLFQKFCHMGKELIDLHLLESSKVSKFITTFPVPGDHRVEKGHPVFKEIENKIGRVYINPSQYFEGISEDAWNFHIGGYQVLEKWLKDRRGHQLTYEDLTHYQKVVVALTETIRMMEEIDKAIPEWPIK